MTILIRSTAARTRTAGLDAAESDEYEYPRDHVSGPVLRRLRRTRGGRGRNGGAPQRALGCIEGATTRVRCRGHGYGSRASAALS
jgi:hypothetical protein